MAAFQSSASAGDAGERMSSMLKLKLKEVEDECGEISTSQEELLARSRFLGDAGEEPEVFSTAPEQSTQGQGGDGITKSTLPVTQCSSSPPPSSSEDHGDDSKRRKRPRKPRICTRKVRGTRIRTPTPSPSPNPDPDPDRAVRSEEDPLYRAVLMIPSASAPAPTVNEDILELARRCGIFS